MWLSRRSVSWSSCSQKRSLRRQLMLEVIHKKKREIYQCSVDHLLNGFFFSFFVSVCSYVVFVCVLFFVFVCSSLRCFVLMDMPFLLLFCFVCDIHLVLPFIRVPLKHGSLGCPQQTLCHNVNT